MFLDECVHLSFVLDKYVSEKVNYWLFKPEFQDQFELLHFQVLYSSKVQIIKVYVSIFKINTKIP